VLLHRARGGDDDDKIDPAIAARLEQQRYVENGEAMSGAARARQEGALLGADHWVKDRLQPGQRRAVAKDRVAQQRPVEHAVADGAGKGARDRTQGAAASRLEPVDGRVGIEDRNARAPEKGGGGRLPHADPAGQADDPHPAPRSARTKRRNAASTTGSTPNQAAKPGRAWCSSIPSPSTTRSPRARAAASSPVSSGV